MSDVDFELLERLIREARDESRLTRTELGERISALGNKVTEGFVNLRAHDFTHHTDMAMMERRVSDLELAIQRISHAEGINTD